MKRNVMKFFSTVLVVTMLFTCMVFHASATADQYFMVTSGEGKPGDTVSVTVSMSDVKKLKGIQGRVNYDATALSLSDRDVEENRGGQTEDPELDTSPATMLFSSDIFEDSNYMKFLAARRTAYSEVETAQPVVMVLHFKVKNTAANGVYPITITDGIAVLTGGTVEPLGEPKNGTITVTGAGTTPVTGTGSEDSSNTDADEETGHTYTPLETPTPTAKPVVTPTPKPTSIAAATPTPAPVPGGKPKDIAEVSWATEYIADVIDRGIMKGYVEADGSITFKPSGTATRAEFATALFNYLGYSKDGTAGFADTQDHWAKDYIAKMVKEGIMSGYNDTQFGPNDPVTREQMATILDRAFKPKAAFDNFPYTDESEISSWAEDSVYAVQSVGWMSGDAAGTFRPTATATRAEIATIFSRLAKANVK